MSAQEAWPEIWDFIRPLIYKVLSGEESVFMEDLLLPIHRNGELENVYWTFSYSPVIDEDGVRAGVLVTCHETTRTNELLLKFQNSERRFQNLIRNAEVGIIILCGAGLTVEIVNNAYGKLIDRTVEELLGKPIFTIIPEAEPVFKPIIDRVISSGDPIHLSEKPYHYFKGEKKVGGYLNLVYQPFREVDSEITGVMVLCQDVTEQVKAKLAIETALDRIKMSKEAAQLGMFDMDLEQGNLEWDSRCRTLFGISDSDKVTYERDFVGGLHPDDRDRIIAIIDNLFLRIPETGDYDVEYRTVGAEDKHIRWVRAKGKMYFDAHHKPVRFIGSVLDITPEKINEARKNDFITMVSHELKTPLTSLTGYLQLLLREAGEVEDDLKKNVLHRANIQVKKMTGLVNGFLNVSRFESGKLELRLALFSLTQLIEESIEGLNLGSHRNRIEFVCDASYWIRADKEKIDSVVSNLLSNALKYSDGKVTVTCAASGECIEVSVTDTGMGISPEDMRFIFDRFCRVNSSQTKDIGGFGIGLYTSAEIIKMHGGKLWVESEYGKGATFHFSLQRINE